MRIKPPIQCSLQMKPTVAMQMQAPILTGTQHSCSRLTEAVKKLALRSTAIIPLQLMMSLPTQGMQFTTSDLHNSPQS